MSKAQIFVYTLLITLGISSLSVRADIVPVPRKIEYKNVRFKLNKSLSIFLNVAPLGSKERPQDLFKKMIKPAEIINETFKEHLDIDTYLANRLDKSQIILEIRKPEEAESYGIPEDMREEGYVIEITEKQAVLRAYSLKGIFYAAMTFVQIIEDSQTRDLPGLTIIDWPDYKIRGVSDDISRGQVPTLETFKKIIRQLARYKLNTYMLYIEDVIPIKKYPNFGSGRDTLTNLAELMEYADKYFVDIVPIFETLGHQENLLHNPEFQYLAEFPGAMSLCIACEDTYTFLDNAIRDLAKKFPSEYIHIGADESFDAGYGKSSSLKDSLGISGLHLKHYLRLYDICKKYNKKMILYGDMLLKHPELISKLPDDVVIMNWQYGKESYYPSNKLFYKSGKNYWVSPSAHNYKSVFPLHTYAFPNIQQLSKDGLTNKASGLVVANWGDLGSETFSELLYPVYGWTAQCGWTNNKANRKDFEKYFLEDFFNLEEDSCLQEIYHLMSDSSTNFTWHEMWRHPLLPPRKAMPWQIKKDPLVFADLLEAQNEKIKTLFDSLPDITRNQGNLTNLDVLLQIREYYAFKLKTTTKLAALRKGETLDSTQKANLKKLITENIRKLESLKNTYGSNWTKYYRKIGLGFIFDKFDRLIAYFEEINNDLSNWIDIDNAINDWEINGSRLIEEKKINEGEIAQRKADIALKKQKKEKIKTRFLDQYLIQSKWIYAVDKDKNQVQSATFRTSFNLQELPLRAYLQVIANTHAEIKINGKYIDTLSVRNIFSAFLEQKRFGYYVIRNQLRIGRNSIEIKVKNYNEGLQLFLEPYKKQVPTGAGINVFGRVNTLSEEVIIRGNGNWTARGERNTILTPTLVEPEQPIIAPNFYTGRTSWFER